MPRETRALIRTKFKQSYPERKNLEVYFYCSVALIQFVSGIFAANRPTGPAEERFGSAGNRSTAGHTWESCGCRELDALHQREYCQTNSLPRCSKAPAPALTLFASVAPRQETMKTEKRKPRTNLLQDVTRCNLILALKLPGPPNRAPFVLESKNPRFEVRHTVKNPSVIVRF